MPQGYHDIITVILLTVAPEETLACAEKLSLHRLRDAMGEGLEPLLGLLQYVTPVLGGSISDMDSQHHEVPLASRRSGVCGTS